MSASEIHEIRPGCLMLPLHFSVRVWWADGSREAAVLDATLIGAYLGFLWFAAGNLLAPITTHAFYDFVAPVYFLRAHVRQHRAARIKD